MDSIRADLQDEYLLYAKMLSVCYYSDPSHKKRLFIVGSRRKMGQAAREFRWPKPDFDSDTCLVARDIAVDDASVPERYWRHDRVEDHMWCDTINQRRDQLHVLARAGYGMGPSDKPNSFLGWDGQLNGQTKLNGGGRRPELCWQPGQEIRRSRLTVPVGTVRAASLPDGTEHNYQDWCSKFATGDRDDFLRGCVNDGVPLRVGTAIDACVMAVLQLAEKRELNKTECWASLAWQHGAVRSTLFDTGANGSINFRDVEPDLMNAKPLQLNITVANKQSLEVGMDGVLPLRVLNSANHAGMPDSVDFMNQTTTADVNYELFSFDPLYRGGWGFHARPISVEHGTCELYKPSCATSGAAEVNVPLRYNRGLWLDYLMIKDCRPEHKALLACHHADMLLLHSAVTATPVPSFSPEESRAFMGRAEKDSCVVDVVVSKHSEDRPIRGVKAGLKARVQKLPLKEFHDRYGHLGTCPGGGKCLICALVKGVSRRIYSKVDPHREERPGHTWYLDTVTWDHRSIKGNKFMSPLRDLASNKYVVLCHYLRSDVVDLIEQFIKKARADPAYHNCSYKVVSVIKLDNAGEWAKNCQKFQCMCDNLGVDLIYSCPDRNESAAHAERSVGITEVVVKCLLMQNSLPPWWWENCAMSAQWLLDRFPSNSLLEGVSVDGDSPRPLEVFSRFTYSRRTIDRELSRYLAPGTPALVQTKALGSAIEPKSRWGVAVAMYRDQTIFLCPYQHSEFRSKSWAAFYLIDGMNYSQFLGLGEMESSRRAVAIPIDLREKLVIKLPKQNWFSEYTTADGVVADVSAPSAVLP